MAHQDKIIQAARREFVCARIGQMNGVDIARFEFDYDTTWTGFFLDADLNIYSRYGGRDSREADARMSRESLLATMADVLQTHRRIQATPEARRQSVRIEETHPAPIRPEFPEDMPLLKANHEGCLHCHQVQEYRLLQSYQDGNFDRKQLFGYPLPENLGIRLSIKNGRILQSVDPNSKAETAGLRSGDEVLRVNGIPIRSEYDIRWALHKAPNEMPLLFYVRRFNADLGELKEISLTPSGAWRQSDLGWRKSLRSVPFPIGILGYSLDSDGLREHQFPENTSAVKVISIRGDGLGTNLRLQKGDLIYGVGTRGDYRTFDQFKSRILEEYLPGDQVELQVLRAGRKMKLAGKLPSWYTEETTVP